jgi:putative hydrolase of the HAD superfamily
MKKPKMILFDYGQTLVNEKFFDGVKGTAEVLKYAIVNKENRTPEEIQAVADAINHELGRFDPLRKHHFQVEVPNDMFARYLYESQGIKLSIPYNQVDKIFWDAASPGTVTDGIIEFLCFLKEQGIRTGVISNISYSGRALEERINALFPEHKFEFIIATSEYMFRKPNHRIFDLALKKAELQAEDVWYIGDQYECDIVGSTNAGMFPVWYMGAIDMPYVEKDDVLTIMDWNELRKELW